MTPLCTGGVRVAVRCAGNSTYSSGARERRLIMHGDSWMGRVHMTVEVGGVADADLLWSYSRSLL